MRGAQRLNAGRGANGSDGARRTRRIVVASGVLALLLVAPLSVDRFGAVDLAQAAVQRAKSFLQLIQQRSPGARTRGLLANTKHKKVVLHQRALPKVRMALPKMPPVTNEPPLIDIVVPPVPVVPAGFELASLPPFSAPSPPANPLIPPRGLIVPPSETPPTPPIIPPPAVPEPETWATMLLGLGLIGWSLRRRVSKVRAQPAEA
jgi:hypothetical protein